MPALCLTCRFYDDRPPFAGDLPETYGRCTWSPDLRRLPAVTMLGLDLLRANGLCPTTPSCPKSRTVAQKGAAVSGYHCLVPTITAITLGSGIFFGSLAPSASMPYSVNANANSAAALAAPPGILGASIDARIDTPDTVLNVAGPHAVSVRRRPTGSTRFQSAACNTESKIQRNRSDSAPVAIDKKYSCPLNFFIFCAISARCLGDSALSALNFSNASWASLACRSASAARASASAVAVRASAMSALARSIATLDSSRATEILASASARDTPIFSSASERAAAISLRDCSRASSQWCSLTFAVRTIMNVAITPPTKQASSARFATSPHNIADGRDIPSNGHIPLPDWFFLGGIAVVLLTGTYSIFLQIRHILRRKDH